MMTDKTSTKHGGLIDKNIYVFRIWHDDDWRVHWKPYSGTRQSCRLAKVVCSSDPSFFSGSELDFTSRFLESIRLCEFIGDDVYDSGVLFTPSLSSPERTLNPMVCFLGSVLARSCMSHVNLAFFDGASGDSWLAAHVPLIGVVLRDIKSQSAAISDEDYK
ncbi:MAG: hypothetical protein KatS3mg087_1534 [Patescibacteria group bacterium]|nr:MAG: hypothetical protein KatS3mg087_1534 [Patescibacteria group bacterium]